MCNFFFFLRTNKSFRSSGAGLDPSGEWGGRGWGASKNIGLITSDGEWAVEGGRDAWRGRGGGRGQRRPPGRRDHRGGMEREGGEVSDLLEGRGGQARVKTERQG